jgi:hypothetical protein
MSRLLEAIKRVEAKAAPRAIRRAQPENSSTPAGFELHKAHAPPSDVAVPADIVRLANQLVASFPGTDTSTLALVHPGPLDSLAQLATRLGDQIALLTDGRISLVAGSYAAEGVTEAANELLATCSGIFLLIVLDETDSRAAQQALGRLQRVGFAVRGCVVVDRSLTTGD